MGQGVGFLPYQAGRFNHGWQVRTEPRANFNTPPDHAGHKLLFDTIVQGRPALDFLVSSVGQRACCWGATTPSTWGRRGRGWLCQRPISLASGRVRRSGRTRSFGNVS
jgi:aminocarboxymuconate-semialdehyde decarboxylase